MSRHAAPRRRAPRPRPIPTKPLSAAALVAVAVLLLMPGNGTFAYWSDQGTMKTADFSSGTVDLSLDGSMVGAAANGATTTYTAYSLSAMLPGESKSVSVSVGNAGTANLTYALNGTATGALAPGLRFSVYVGGTATNTGTAAAGNRTGTCGGTALATDVTLTGTESALVSARRTINAGASETICVITKMDTGAANSLQGTTATASIIFDSRQVGV